MSHPLQELRPGAPGGLRFILLRFVLLLAVGIPAAGGGYALTSKTLGADPRYVGGQVPELTVLTHVMGEARAVGFGLALAGLLAFIVADQLLTASALLMLDAGQEQRGVWRTIWNGGWPNLLPLLRLSVLVALLLFAGIALLKFPVEWLSDRAFRDGWTRWNTSWIISGGRLTIALLWLHCLGALARWARVLIVADGKRRARRVILHALRAVWRAPFRTAVYFVLIPLVVQIGGAALLASTVPLEIAPFEDAVLGHAAWAGYLFLQACVWYFLLHRARVLLAADRFDDIRAGADEPFVVSLFRRLRGTR